MKSVPAGVLARQSAGDSWFEWNPGERHVTASREDLYACEIPIESREHALQRFRQDGHFELDSVF